MTARARRGEYRLHPDGYACPGPAFVRLATSAAFLAAAGIPADSFFVNGDNGGAFPYRQDVTDVRPVWLRALKAGLRVMPCCAMPCCAGPCHAMPCYAMPCHAMPCHAMPCRAMSCHAVPCHAMPMPCHAKAGLRVMPYSGDADADVNGFATQDKFVELLGGAGLAQTQPWRPWAIDGKQHAGGYAVEWSGGAARCVSVRRTPSESDLHAPLPPPPYTQVRERARRRPHDPRVQGGGRHRHDEQLRCGHRPAAPRPPRARPQPAPPLIGTGSLRDSGVPASRERTKGGACH